jgi:hypothetical protein
MFERYRGQKRCKQGFIGKPDEKRQLGRSRRKWKDNIKIDIPEVRWEGTEGIDLGQDSGI